MPRERKQHFISHFWKTAANAAKKGTLTAGYDAKVEPHIFINGRTSPSVDELVAEVGFEEAWRFLKSNGAAYGMNSDKVVAFLEREG
jgi:hypothetical protein